MTNTACRGWTNTCKLTKAVLPDEFTLLILPEFNWTAFTFSLKRGSSNAFIPSAVHTTKPRWLKRHFQHLMRYRESQHRLGVVLYHRMYAFERQAHKQKSSNHCT